MSDMLATVTTTTQPFDEGRFLIVAVVPLYGADNTTALTPSWPTDATGADGIVQCTRSCLLRIHDNPPAVAATFARRRRSPRNTASSCACAAKPSRQTPTISATVTSCFVATSTI